MIFYKGSGKILKNTHTSADQSKLPKPKWGYMFQEAVYFITWFHYIFKNILGKIWGKKT